MFGFITIFHGFWRVSRVKDWSLVVVEFRGF